MPRLYRNSLICVANLLIFHGKTIKLRRKFNNLRRKLKNYSALTAKLLRTHKQITPHSQQNFSALTSKLLRTHKQSIPPTHVTKHAPHKQQSIYPPTPLYIYAHARDLPAGSRASLNSGLAYIYAHARDLPAPFVLDGSAVEKCISINTPHPPSAPFIRFSTPFPPHKSTIITTFLQKSSQKFCHFKNLS